MIVACGDKDIGLFKVSRVRQFEAEASDDYLRVRREMAAAIRANRRQKRANRQAELEREDYLGKRLAEQIR